MRILRLAGSDDALRDVPEELRSPAIAEAAFSQAVGEPVETIVRPIWPDPHLPELLERWLDQYQPDLVFFYVVPFWYVYESVPIRVQRQLGRLGGKLSEAGRRVASKPFASSLPFRALRLASLRTVGGETPFTPEQVLDVSESCIRRVVAREDVVLVVIGSTGRRCTAYGWGGPARDQARRAVVHNRLTSLRAELHVPYFGGDSLMQSGEWKALLGPDRTHLSVEGQRTVGLEQAAHMLAAWERAGRRVPAKQETGG